MNWHLHNLNRIEFVITFACTGRCKHCSEGNHASKGEFIDGNAAAQLVYRVCESYEIKSLMTFGGEPLLHLEEVCRIHTAALEMKIPARQLITNGYFTKSEEKIEKAAKSLAKSGVNDILLSVDAFHQETIPLKPVMDFAMALKALSVPIRTHPAWLTGKDADNRYNQRTREILREFELSGINASNGNVIFPSGNALKYLSEYFDPNKTYINQYEELSAEVASLCINPDGGVLGGNIYQNDILDIIANYSPT